MTGDGAVTGHVIATYLHGQVLARDPASADHLISRATNLSPTTLEVPGEEAVRAYYLPSRGSVRSGDCTPAVPDGTECASPRR